jgi:type IX secretion system PorP/SprF family membrane protein
MRLFISIMIFMFPLYAIGQQYVMSDNFGDDALALNPAYAGSQQALCATIHVRNYLADFEGSPNTMSLSIHAPLKKEKIGLGFLITNDKFGVSNETNIMSNYAYRMDLGSGNLAFGLAFGMTLRTTNWAKLAAQDAGDAQLMQNSSTGPLPNFSSGIYYLTKKYFIGLSVPLFLTYEYNPSKGKYSARNNFADCDYFLNAGYVMNIDQDIRFFPSLLLKYHKGSSSELDINAQIILKNKIWLGVAYHTNKSMVAMLQYQLNNQLRIAYYHDFMIGNAVLHKYSSQGITLNYVFNYSVEIAGPRQF